MNKNISVAATWKSCPLQCMSPQHAQTSLPPPSQETPGQLWPAGLTWLLTVSVGFSARLSGGYHFSTSSSSWWQDIATRFWANSACLDLLLSTRPHLLTPSLPPPPVFQLPGLWPSPVAWPTATLTTETCQTTKYWEDFPCHIKDPLSYNKSMHENEDRKTPWHRLASLRCPWLTPLVPGCPGAMFW